MGMTYLQQQQQAGQSLDNLVWGKSPAERRGNALEWAFSSKVQYRKQSGGSLLIQQGHSVLRSLVQTILQCPLPRKTAV